MVADYERAWVRVQALIASKSQHGREPTLTAMAEILEDCRVPAGELSRLLRLYGVEVERARSMATGSDPAVEPDSRGDHLPAGTVPARDIIDRGGHDGGRNGVTAGAAG